MVSPITNNAIAQFTMLSPKQLINFVKNSADITQNNLKKLIGRLQDPLNCKQNYDDCIAATNLYLESKISPEYKNAHFRGGLNDLCYGEIPTFAYGYYRFKILLAIKNNKLCLRETSDINHFGCDVSFGDVELGAPTIGNMVKIIKFLTEIGHFADTDFGSTPSAEFCEEFDKLEFDKTPTKFNRISVMELKKILTNMAFNIPIHELKNLIDRLIDPCSLQLHPEQFFVCCMIKNQFMTDHGLDFSCYFEYHYASCHWFKIKKNENDTVLNLYITEELKVVCEMHHDIIEDARIFTRM